MKGDLTFLDELVSLLCKYYGENWQWKFEKLGELGGGSEIILTIDEEDKDDLD